jgi:hypothetical protein
MENINYITSLFCLVNFWRYDASRFNQFFNIQAYVVNSLHYSYGLFQLKYQMRVLQQVFQCLTALLQAFSLHFSNKKRTYYHYTGSGVALIGIPLSVTTGLDKIMKGHFQKK